MSTSADNARAARTEGLERLEKAVGHAVARLGALEREVEAERRRASDAERLLARIAGGELDAGGISERLEGLEAENELLRARMAEARGAVELLMARIRFLEEQR